MADWKNILKDSLLATMVVLTFTSVVRFFIYDEVNWGLQAQTGVVFFIVLTIFSYFRKNRQNNK